VKRAFTLIELLVVIAIIAILAAILFPVFAQAKVMAKKASDLSNNKQIMTSTLMYGTDNDDLFPFQTGALSTTGAWGYNTGSTLATGQMLVPYNYTTLALTTPLVQYSQGFAMNTVQPYAKSYPIMVSPGGTTDPYGAPAAAITATPTNYVTQKITYAYNGLLSGYNTSSINSPATVPVWTSMNGSLAASGWGEANPQLNCPTPAVPCNYVPSANNTCAPLGNGTKSVIAVMATSLPLWVFNQGQNWAYYDGHAKYRKLANSTGSATNYTVEPFENNNINTGVPTSNAWWDNCHAWLFRPDYVPVNGFN
jgi:prepilin-type N-terminal cleavage/methylation domain-containing protein